MVSRIETKVGIRVYWTCCDGRTYSCGCSMRRRDLLKVGAAPLTMSGMAVTPASAGALPGVIDRTVIQKVCAWPNLQRLPDDSLVALIFNQPCHGLWEGDLDCWASEDDGKTWRFRGRPAEHEPTTNRMNCAAGFAKNGDLVVLCSGWADRAPVGTLSGPHQRVLRAWVSRSSDGGKTWSIGGVFPRAPETEAGRDNELIPFGNIRIAADGSLGVACYLRKGNLRECYLVRSNDDGRNWTEVTPLNLDGNETDILHLGGGRWLAASREFREKRDVHVELFASSDDARTWQRRMPLSLPMQVTGNLTQLADGRVLASYGNRCWNNFGVDVRLSKDNGETWSPPIRIANCPRSDCGYPSSVQRADGRVVTAYYTQVSEDFHYEMRVATWDPNGFSVDGRPVG